MPPHKRRVVVHRDFFKSSSMPQKSSDTSSSSAAMPNSYVAPSEQVHVAVVAASVLEEDANQTQSDHSDQPDPASTQLVAVDKHSSTAPTAETVTEAITDAMLPTSTTTTTTTTTTTAPATSTTPDAVPPVADMSTLSPFCSDGPCATRSTTSALSAHCVPVLATSSLPDVACRPIVQHASQPMVPTIISLPPPPPPVVMAPPSLNNPATTVLLDAELQQLCDRRMRQARLLWQLMCSTMEAVSGPNGMAVECRDEQLFFACAVQFQRLTGEQCVRSTSQFYMVRDEMCQRGCPPEEDGCPACLTIHMGLDDFVWSPW